MMSVTDERSPADLECLLTTTDVRYYRVKTDMFLSLSVSYYMYDTNKK